MRAVAVAVVVVLALGGADARADRKTAEARALYQKATAHYDLAEYDVAIAEFKQAYELTREPGLLFNIAQAYRLEKDYAQALHFYRTYVELKPNAANRGDAEDEIRRMKEALAATPPAATAAPAPAPAPPPVAKAPPIAPSASPPPPPRSGAATTPALAAAPPGRRAAFVHSRRGQATIALAAVGAAALVAGAATGGEALALRSRYDRGCAAGPCDGALYSRGRSFAIASDVLLGVGVVAAVAATVVALVHRRERPITVGMRF